MFEGMEVVAVSPSTPQDHQQLQEEYNIQFEILTDIDYLFAIEHGFVDEEEGAIYRGYLGVNPDTGAQSKEIDYLVGQNTETIAELMEDL
ncbi:peroxiredoxin family protein [Bacillus alkalicola]|uniref:Peroxiredoxin family protein n=1 Tax=Evansella alkalicola TaxID=745819 RepID=A0ABS6JXK4_9BACI|nr:peroxiredoxin family protein [Bacillus alkalicola]